jgi:mono/diheme cytochrome c family protein
MPIERRTDILGGYRPTKRQGLTLIATLAAALVVSACERTDTTAEAPEQEGDAVWAFATPAAAEVDVFEHRMPGDPGETIAVPATDLFPGGVRVTPPIQNPYEGDERAIAEGARHFNAFNCSGCHAPMGGGGMGPPLSREELIYGNEPAQIYLSIMHGRPEGMPAFGAMLPKRTAWELVAYIQELPNLKLEPAPLGFTPPGAEAAEADEAEDAAERPPAETPTETQTDEGAAPDMLEQEQGDDPPAERPGKQPSAR